MRYYLFLAASIVVFSAFGWSVGGWYGVCAGTSMVGFFYLGHFLGTQRATTYHIHLPPITAGHVCEAEVIEGGQFALIFSPGMTSTIDFALAMEGGSQDRAELVRRALALYLVASDHQFCGGEVLLTNGNEPVKVIVRLSQFAPTS